VKIFLFPIEPIQMRYSADWYRWWPAELKRLRHTVLVVDGDRLPVVNAGIERGEFLDAYDTHYYKATQLARFAAMLASGAVKHGDVVLLLDGWNPAVEQLGYMRAVGGVRFSIAGLMHAGTWDRWDHLTQVGMRPWAKHAERGWAQLYDRLFFATQFHASMFLKGVDAGLDEDALCEKIRVTGFPLYAKELADYRQPWEAREQLVVFPHRLAPEKEPEGFDRIRQEYERRYPENASHVHWLRTKDVCRVKHSYLSTLGQARVVVSTALQETWGIAMLEGVACGAWPVAPDRLSYRETLANFNRWRTWEEAADLVHYALTSEPASPELHGFGRWETAIETIAAELPR
jgi:hypothetical protein